MGHAGARRHWLIWAAAVPVAVWAGARLLGLERGFPFVPLMAYTPYVAVAALLVTGVCVALRNWAAAVVSLLATTCLAAAVLPRAVGGTTPVGAGEAELAVLSINVHHGTADPEALIALVRRRDPDVLAIQELTPSFAAKLERQGIGRALPNEALSMRPGASGGGLYTRLPLRQLREPQPFAFRMPRAQLELAGGRRVRVVDVHPYPPELVQVGRWRAGLESLPSSGPGEAPWILAGDFNATLDHAELRDVLDRGYRDAAEVAGMGLTATWPAAGSRLPPVTIDHVLADRRLGIAEYAVEDMPGSDHRAVFARLSVPRSMAPRRR
jgi:endonuclease/exonuclease/phosphatase (EEP) superfamily protein YafD